MANKAVFWDRDGTLVRHFDYLVNVKDVALIRGAASAVKYLKDRGYKTVVVTNQSAVARGMITEKELAEINRRFTSLLLREGATIDKLYYCPFHPEAVIEKYRKDSDLRKPAPGMLLQAAQDLDLDLSQCWMIGDDDRDILAGQAAGCRTILIKHQATELVQRGKSTPDFVACSPQEAANIVAHYSNKPTETTPPASEQATDQELLQTQDQPLPEPQIINEIIDNKCETEHQPESVELIFDPMPEESAGLNMTVDTSIPDNFAVIPEINQQFQEKKQPDINRPTGEVQVLQEILRELKKHNTREEGTKPEFSGSTLIAGITQILVLLCLIMAYIATSGDNSSLEKVQCWLLTGLVFQLMTVSLMMMNR